MSAQVSSALIKPATVLSAIFRKKAFSLEKAFSIGFMSALSAALQPGHEPDRKSLLQTESLLTENCREDCRGFDKGARNLRRHLQTRRMRKLLQRLRL